MIYFEFTRKDGTVLFSTLAECSVAHSFTSEENIRKQELNARHVFQDTDFGKIRLLIVGDTKDSKYIASAKEARKLIAAFSDAHKLFIDFEKNNQKQIKGSIDLFVHNLVQVHTHLKDKIDRIFNLDVQRAGDYKEQKEKVKTAIGNDMDKAADDICQIAKRLDDLDAQLTCFKIMSGVFRGIPPNTINANLKKVLLRNAQPFLEELRQIKVSINFIDDDEKYEKNKAKIDPKMINAALHHFFQNMTKYTLPSSEVSVVLSPGIDNTEVSFVMNSVRIEKHELESIFNRGVSGENVGMLAGQGIGMAVMKAALGHFGAFIRIEPNYSCSENFAGRHYVLNKFIFTFPR